MDSSFRFRPCSHRHFCYHHHPCCRHHHYHHHHHHCNFHLLGPGIGPLPLQYPQSNCYSASQSDLNLQPNFYKETPAYVQVAEEETKQNELDNDDEEEDDPIFVLTDEWREFFAKSEAKRKLEKQKAKKKDRQS